MLHLAAAKICVCVGGGGIVLVRLHKLVSIPELKQSSCISLPSRFTGTDS